MSARSKNSGSATRTLRNATIAGSFASQIGSSRSQPPCGSSAMTRASPWIVSRPAAPPTATGSVIDDDDLRVRVDVLELAAEQRRRRQVHAVAVRKRDQRVGHRAPVRRTTVSSPTRAASSSWRRLFREWTHRGPPGPAIRGAASPTD